MRLFFKRLGVLKTKNMLKIFDKLDAPNKLRELLQKNYVEAEKFRRIEAMCKLALKDLSPYVGGKLFVRDMSPRSIDKFNDDKFKKILKTLGVEEGMVALQIVCYALQCTSIDLLPTPKDEKRNIDELYTAAKNEKRRRKSAQQEIYNNLKKWHKLSKKCKEIADKVKYADATLEQLNVLADDLDIPLVKYGIIPSSSKVRESRRYKEKYQTIVSEMAKAKNNIRTQLLNCGFESKDVDEVYKDMSFPGLPGADKSGDRHHESAQQEIYDSLEKWRELSKKCVEIVNKAESDDDMLDGLIVYHYKDELLPETPKIGKFYSYKKKYQDIVSKMIKVKNNIRTQLLNGGYESRDVDKMYNDMRYPDFLSAADIRKLKEQRGPGRK